MQRLLLFLAIYGIFAAATSWAQQTDGSTAPQRLLTAMRDNLAETPRLQFTTQFSSVDKGIGRTIKGSVDYMIEEPNLMRVTVKTRDEPLVIVSDGTVLTIHEPSERRYRDYPTGKTVLGTLSLASGLMSRDARLVDFMRGIDFILSGEDEAKIKGLGTRSIGGRSCGGLAIEREEDTWKVWISTAAPHRPCMLISESHGAALITQTNTFSWKANPQFKADTFRFVPPKGHVRD